MGNAKQINIKKRTYYFFNDMINIKDFGPSLIKIDTKSYKNIGICHISVKISDCEYINSVNPLYLMTGEVDRYIEENNENKYLTFASTDKNKKVLEKFAELRNENKYNIQTINVGKSGECNSIEYEKGYMRIKFNSDVDLPLNKTVKLRMLKIIFRLVLEEDDIYYPQVFLDECLHEE